jgi:hypothetical protein
MAAPGTITHVLEVARQLAAAADAHAAAVTETAAAAAPVPEPPASGAA